MTTRRRFSLSSVAEASGKPLFFNRENEKGAAERTWALCPPLKPFCVARRLGRGEKRKRTGDDGIVLRALIPCAAGRLEEEDGKMLKCDKRDRAITCVFGRDIHWTLMFSDRYQKDLSKEKRSLAKIYFKQTYCRACHTRFSVFFPLPSRCVKCAKKNGKT